MSHATQRLLLAMSLFTLIPSLFCMRAFQYWWGYKFCYSKYDGFILSVTSDELKGEFETRYCYQRKPRTAIIKNPSTGCLFVPYKKGENPGKTDATGQYSCLAENGRWYRKNQIMSIAVNKTLPQYGEVEMVQYCGDRFSSCCQSVLENNAHRSGYCEVFTVDSSFFGFKLVESRQMSQPFDNFFGKMPSEDLLFTCVHFLRKCSSTSNDVSCNSLSSSSLSSKQITINTVNKHYTKRTIVCMFANCVDIIWM